MNAGKIYGCWTVDTIEYDDQSEVTADKDGIGTIQDFWSEGTASAEACYSFADTSAVTTTAITAMNEALTTYDTNFDYKWQSGTDGWPTTVKVSD